MRGKALGLGLPIPAMKRPTAQKPRQTSTGNKDEDCRIVWTEDGFDLQSFLASVLREAGMELSQGGLRRQTPLIMAGGCDRHRHASLCSLQDAEQ